MRIALLTLALVACLKPPEVPRRMLVDLSPDAVERVATLRSEADDLGRQIAAAEANLRHAQADEDAARTRLDAGRTALAAEDDLKRAAVAAGDPQAATRADARRAADQAAVDRAERALEAAASWRELQEAELEELRAHRALVDARVQLEQARGVSDSGGQLDLGRFERAVGKAADREARAVDAVGEARARVQPEAQPTT